MLNSKSIYVFGFAFEKLLIAIPNIDEYEEDKEFSVGKKIEDLKLLIKYR